MNLDNIQKFKDLEELFYHLKQARIFLYENTSLVLEDAIVVINEYSIFCISSKDPFVTPQNIFFIRDKESLRAALDKIISINEIIYKAGYYMIKNHTILSGKVFLKLEPI